jgi:peptide/nickel transport system substrate-binding protein
VPTGYKGYPAPQVGTGAYKLKSFTPGQQSVHERNPNYWRTGEPYFDTVTIIDFSDSTAQVNGLLGGQIDAMTDLPPSQVKVVQARGMAALVSKTGGWLPICMAIDLPPFNDARVRQAMRLLVDRPGMLQQVASGYGFVGNDLYAPFDPGYLAPPAVPQRHQDISEAKSLLKAAGHADLQVELITGDLQGGVTAAAQVFVQQAASAGVSVNIHKVTPNQFFAAHNYTFWPFAQDWWFYNFYLPQVALTTTPGAPGNETHWDNSRYISLYKQAIAQPDEQLRYEIEHEMQMIDYNEGGLIVPYFQPIIDATAANVHGVVPSRTGGSFNSHMGASDYKYFWIS